MCKSLLMQYAKASVVRHYLVTEPNTKSFKNLTIIFQIMVDSLRQGELSFVETKH